MIEIDKVQDDLTYSIDIPIDYESSKLIDRNPDKLHATITLTGADLKKLILILNLSIGNMPENAPDVTDFVRDLTKRIGFGS